MSLQCLLTSNMVLSDEDKILIKSLYLKQYTAERLRDEFPEKSWTKGGVTRLFKKLRDTGTVDRQRQTTHTLKKMRSFFFRSSRSLQLTLFCRLSSEATENIFSSVKNKVSGILWELLKQKVIVLYESSAVRVCQLLCTAPLETFQLQVLTVIWDRDDGWIPISRDISRTVLWVCGLSSSLRTKSLTVSTFLSVRAQIDDKSK